MLKRNVADNTIKELLSFEHVVSLGKKTSARKTKQWLKAYRYRLDLNQGQ
jgi:2-succinyl-5-enolpyruvyl-6-hydroxy-3-cyclohexene-1-carboxylate synthase